MVPRVAPASPYRSLNSTIRLLKISRSSNRPELVAQLESFSLNSPNCPNFTTVSYAWGSPLSFSKEILLGDFHWPVLDSLYPFLEFICDSKELQSREWWWIDSICINLKDNDERSSQLQLMGRIYKQALETIVWLGEGSDESDDAVDFLWFLQKTRWKHDAQDGKIDRSKFRSLRDPKYKKKWNAVQSFLLKLWWKRVWTLQEFIVSPNLELYCGKSHIRRSAFKSAMYAIWLAGGAEGELISKAAFDWGWNRRRMHMWYESTGELPLIATMAYVGDSEASDEKDRIYSFLGIARLKDREMVSQPNYETALREVYTKLVESFVMTYRNMDIICFAHDFSHGSDASIDEANLPSWVPNWSKKVPMKVVPLMVSQARGNIGNFRPIQDRDSTAVYAASGVRKPHVIFSSDSKALICTGVLIDYIDGLGGGKAQQCIQSTSLLNCSGPSSETFPEDTTVDADSENWEHVLRPESPNEDENFSALREIISRCLLLDRKDRYLNHHADCTRTSAEMQAFCRAAVMHPEVVHHFFLDWFQKSRYLKIRGQILGDLFDTPPTLLSSSFTNFKSMSERDTFLTRLRDTTATLERRLAVTEHGHLAMAPSRAEKGDVVCVLLGCSVPVILRKRNGNDIHEFIGECYLDGFMAGEILVDLDTGKRKLQSFRLE